MARGAILKRSFCDSQLLPAPNLSQKRRPFCNSNLINPAQFEAAYHQSEDPSRTARLKDPSLR